MAKRRVFGVSLEKTLSSEERRPDDVPIFVQTAFAFLESNLNGGSLAGVFESAADKAEVHKLYQKVALKKAYDNLHDSKYSAAAVASVLRTLFAEIPEPCVSPAVQQEFVDADALRTQSARVAALAVSVQHLPPAPRALLQRTVEVLSKSKHEHERMAAIWAPLIFRDSSAVFVRVTEGFLEMAGPIFHGTAMPIDQSASPAPPETPALQPLITVDFSKVNYGSGSPPSKSPSKMITPLRRPGKLVMPALSPDAGPTGNRSIDSDHVRVFHMPNLGTPGSTSPSPLTPLCITQSSEVAPPPPQSCEPSPTCPVISTATAFELKLRRVEEQASPGVDVVGDASFAFNPLGADEESDCGLGEDSSEVSFGSIDDVCGDLGLEAEDNKGSPSLIVQGCLNNMPQCVKDDVATALATRLQTPR